MAHFRGIIAGTRADVSRLSHKSAGLRTEAQSWQGKVVTTLEHDAATGQDIATVTLERHEGAGTSQLLYHGPVSGGASS